MKFEEQHSFDQAADTVMKMYSDKAFFDRKYKEMEALECELLDHQVSGSAFSIKYRLVMKSDVPLPEVAKKFLGNTVKMIQEDSWNLETREGRIVIEIRGAPIKIEAHMKLSDQNGKGVNVQNWEVSCKIPLVGGKVEKAVAADIQAKAARDLKISRGIIADY